MSEPTRLIPRDLPIEQGRKLMFTFTVAFDLTVDEDLTGDTDPPTLDDIEYWLGGDYRSSEQIFKALAGHQEREIIEHEVSLDDRYEGADDGPVRFESTWEAKERERGRAGEWPMSRAWLDHVPSAGALPLGPESNPAILAPSAGALRRGNGDLVAEVAYPTAEDVMNRDG
jgi:hypothetical protein